jgi:hypothetical protein
MALGGAVIADAAWHAVKRTISVLVVLAVLVGAPWFAYEKGKTKGYSMCAKDRPTYGQVGTVIESDPKDVPVTLLRTWKVGFVWFRK